MKLESGRTFPEGDIDHQALVGDQPDIFDAARAETLRRPGQALTEDEGHQAVEAMAEFLSKFPAISDPTPELIEKYGRAVTALAMIGHLGITASIHKPKPEPPVLPDHAAPSGRPSHRVSTHAGPYALGP